MSQSSGLPYLVASHESEVQKLYLQLVTGWNERDPKKMSQTFADDGYIIGFDGTRHSGPQNIHDAMKSIFQEHQTPRYVFKIKSLRFLTPEVAQLEAIVGMVPDQKKALDPTLNALQVMTAVYRSHHWTIAHMQNTPAQFHGRPAAVQAMTEELMS